MRPPQQLVVVVLLTIGLTPRLAADWPQWRGPNGTGVASEAAPLEWGTDANVAWRAEIGGLGVSSPIVSGDLVIVTSQTGFSALESGSHPTLGSGEVDGADGPLGGSRHDGDEDLQFLVEAFDRRSGAALWTHSLGARGQLQPVHQKHNLASSSPVSDGERIYATFGTGQTVALTMDGEEVWSRHLGEDYGPLEIIWGYSSSPAVYGDLLILQCDRESDAYLLALDAQTGQDRWKVDRGDGLRSYSTPVVIPGPSGAELIVNSSARLDAFDPLTGAHLWHTGGSNQFPVPVASYADGAIYTSRGYRSGPYMKIRPGGRGDITDTHVEWHVPTGAPYVSSILYYDGLVYMANGGGIITCIDAETGENVWQERLGGVYTASPLAADGRVYFFSETGETLVLAAGRDPVVLARNDLQSRILASPAVSDGHLFIRTDQQIVAIRH